MTELFARRAGRVFPFRGRCPDGDADLRVDVEIAPGATWTYARVYVDGHGEGWIWINLSDAGVPAPNAPAESWSVFEGALFDLVERTIAAWWPNRPVPPKPAPVPLAKRLARVVLRWIDENP